MSLGTASKKRRLQFERSALNAGGEAMMWRGKNEVWRGLEALAMPVAPASPVLWGPPGQCRRLGASDLPLPHPLLS